MLINILPECDSEMEYSLFRMLCLLGSFMSLFVVIPSNVFQNIPFLVNILVAMFGGVTYILYRRSVAGSHHVTLLLLLLVLLLDSTWFPNGGSLGSVQYYFFCTFMYPMVFYRGKSRLLLLTFVVANGLVMILLEHLFPGLITPFRTSFDRTVDLMTGLSTSALAIIMMVWTVMKSYDREREKLLEVNRELEKSLSEINTLQGLLPICAGCKKIKEDDGTWVHIEQYISENSNASFSHGMCPKCIREHYPEYAERVL